MSTVLDTLTTGRTADDLANDTGKAYVAYAGLNRMEQVCTLLAGLLHADIRVKEWGMEDFWTDTEMTRLLGSMKALRTAYFTETSTLVVPAEITYNSVYQANDIKQILKDLGDIYDSMVSGQQRLPFKLGVKAIGDRR